jgi:hypothetical protein
MILNIILAVVFLSSASYLWYRTSLKIPELVAIPDRVITARLEEDSASVRLFLLHFKASLREGRHKKLFWSFLEKSVYRIHILLLKADNGTVFLLKKIRNFSLEPRDTIVKMSARANEPPIKELAWEDIRKDILVQKTASGPKRVQEVRTKRTRIKYAGKEPKTEVRDGLLS